MCPICFCPKRQAHAKIRSYDNPNRDRKREMIRTLFPKDIPKNIWEYLHLWYLDSFTFPIHDLLHHMCLCETFFLFQRLPAFVWCCVVDVAMYSDVWQLASIHWPIGSERFNPRFIRERIHTGLVVSSLLACYGSCWICLKMLGIFPMK